MGIFILVVAALMIGVVGSFVIVSDYILSGKIEDAEDE